MPLYKLHILKDQITVFLLIDSYAFYWEHV